MSIEELAKRAGVTVRTVRYYIAQGLLPGPGARGKAATYTAEHLARLRLIRLLVEQRVPLAEQRERLANLSHQDVRDLLRQEERQEAALERAEATSSPSAYVAALLDRARSRRFGEATPPAWTPPADAAPPRTRHRPTPPGVGWQRWELAPGLDLHARTDVLPTHARLVERLLDDAATHLAAGRHTGEPETAFPAPGGTPDDR